jgi:hypothetical protein
LEVLDGGEEEIVYKAEPMVIKPVFKEELKKEESKEAIVPKIENKP